MTRKTFTTPSPFSTEKRLAFQPPINVPRPRHKPYGKSTNPLKKKVKNKVFVTYKYISN